MWKRGHEVVLCSPLFPNIMDNHISLAQSSGAFETKLIKKEVEGPREPSDEEQAIFYVLQTLPPNFSPTARQPTPFSTHQQTAQAYRKKCWK